MNFNTFIQQLQQSDELYLQVIGLTKNEFDQLYLTYGPKKTGQLNRTLKGEARLYAILLYRKWQLNAEQIGTLILNATNPQQAGETFIKKMPPTLVSVLSNFLHLQTKINSSIIDKKITQNIRMFENILFVIKEPSGFWLFESPVSQLLNRPLSPFMSYLRRTPYDPYEIEHSETYARSEKHPLRTTQNKEKDRMYQGKELGQGLRANVGDYPNPFQLLGDSFIHTTKTLPTLLGDGVLRDRLLDYQRTLVEYIASRIPNDKALYATPVVFNDYPCLMLKIFCPFAASNPAKEAWTNLVICLFTALVNYSAYSNSIPIELVRRSSFCFPSTPAIAPIENSIRLSPGIVPIQYATLLIQCVETLNLLLAHLCQTTYQMPQNIFYYTSAYQTYLGQQEISLSIFNLLQFLFLKVEKGTTGQLTVQNLMRTAYARQRITAEIFNQLIALPPDTKDISPAFVSILCWAIQQIQIVGGKLSFQQTAPIQYNASFQQLKSVNIIDDKNFWQTWNIILERLGLTEQYHKEDFSQFQKSITSQNILTLYFNFEKVIEHMFEHAILTREEHQYGDGYGSNSEDEDEIEGTRLYSKKVIAHNGMRAIYGALLGLREARLIDPSYLIRILNVNSYYEVESGLKELPALHNATGQITVVKTSTEANVILFDLNACITDNDKNQQDQNVFQNSGNKVFILDSTSTTNNRCRKHLELIIRNSLRNCPTIFFVSSGLKHEQLGLDRNHYGTIRIFSPDKKLLEGIYAGIKKHEKPVLSDVSHALRRKMKTAGCVPVVSQFFRPVKQERNDTAELVASPQSVRR